MIFSTNYIMAKTMKKHSKRAAKKAHKRTERKGKKAYRKGSKSKTMKGKKDFTTKKSSKVFNRRKHYQKHAKGSRVVRKPYHKKRGGKLKLNDYEKAYSTRSMRYAKSADHTKMPGVLALHSKAVSPKQASRAQNLNVGVQVGKDWTGVILTNNNPPLTTKGPSANAVMTAGPNLSSKGLINAINATLKQHGYKSEDYAHGVGFITLNTSSRSKLAGSFYDNNYIFNTYMKDQIQKSPTLRNAVAKTIAHYLKPVQSTVNGKPMVFNISNSEEHWAESLL